MFSPSILRQMFQGQIFVVLADVNKHILGQCSYCRWPHPLIELKLYDIEDQPVGQREILEKPVVPYVLAPHTIMGVTCPGSGEQPETTSSLLV
ncbi:MAG: hypothetical protein A3A97_04805 [Candidatus Terrybacteria bacterium RIFCSPLOWO2_01_FULL_40_23]|uniref:Uncharacterized protein n=1 Tax=Candidatus Terrybacteria bacterium RIFCSPLOWO2_01_FULL_40_23 TaxID=1802366 RepID=A0A1G2PV51_9BACT|nr:MAG: hypothetical protein A3A97_04805 [Candidatus Terrybacteria bacterium RIFCSPLOWO2_01_FULL_40_23]